MIQCYPVFNLSKDYLSIMLCKTEAALNNTSETNVRID